MRRGTHCVLVLFKLLNQGTSSVVQLFDVVEGLPDGGSQWKIWFLCEELKALFFETIPSYDCCGDLVGEVEATASHVTYPLRIFFPQFLLSMASCAPVQSRISM